MPNIELKIIDGPDKPALQWAVAYPDRHIHVHFDTATDALDVHVDEVQEMDEPTQFGLKGHISSGMYKGWPFRAIYDLTDRTGILQARDPGPPPPSRA